MKQNGTTCMELPRLSQQREVTASFEQLGFALIRRAIPPDAFQVVENDLIELLAQLSGRRFQSVTGPDFAEFLLRNRELEQELYDGIREYPCLLQLSTHPAVLGLVASVLGDDIGICGKVVLRIDLPQVTRELAVWHQDYHYVGGNTDIVTAWIPLQPTPYDVGCLMVMPESHKLGVLPHNKRLLGKKFIPTGIFERPVRYLEMDRGDALIFSSLLLHSSSLNISDRTRFSIQARYSRISQPVDPSMGGLFPVSEIVR